MRIFVWKNRWEKSSYAEYNDPIKIKFYIILVKSYVTFQARKIEPIFIIFFYSFYKKKKLKLAHEFIFVKYLSSF